MRYLFFLALLTLLALPVPVAAMEVPDPVARVLDAPNKSPVLLIGHMVERVAGKDNKYLFQDDSGKIMVQIEHGIFAGQEITPESRVRLSGRLMRYPGKPLRVDVDELRLLR